MRWPKGVIRWGSTSNRPTLLQTVIAGNYIVGPDTDLSTIPLAESMNNLA